VNADGDAPAVVLDPHAAVGLQHDDDAVGVARHRLVHRVVDDLRHQMVQAALTGRPDVHARALTNRLETFEYLDRGRVVGRQYSGHPRGFHQLGFDNHRALHAQVRAHIR